MSPFVFFVLMRFRMALSSVGLGLHSKRGVSGRGDGVLQASRLHERFRSFTERKHYDCSSVCNCCYTISEVAPWI